jgi:hypothetical protein
MQTTAPIHANCTVGVCYHESKKKLESSGSQESL